MLILKMIHVTAVGTSFILFVTRSISVFTQNTWHKNRIFRVLPHVVDSLLLVSAAGLVVLLHQYPFVQAWLTAKVILLGIYIFLGMSFMKYAKTHTQKAVLFTLSILCFWTIVFIAYHHDISLAS